LPVRLFASTDHPRPEPFDLADTMAYWVKFI